MAAPSALPEATKLADCLRRAESGLDVDAAWRWPGAIDPAEAWDLWAAAPAVALP